MRRKLSLMLSCILLMVFVSVAFVGCGKEEKKETYIFRVTFEPALTLERRDENGENVILTSIDLGEENYYQEILAKNDKQEHYCVVGLYQYFERYDKYGHAGPQLVDCSYEYYYLEPWTEHHSIIEGKTKISEIGTYKFIFTFYSERGPSGWVSLSEPMRVQLFISFI